MRATQGMDSRISAILTASLLLIAAACGGGGSGYMTGVDGGTSGSGGGSGTGNRTTSISMTSSLTFVPAIDTVTVGQTVTWTTQGSIAHTSTSDTGIWDSGTVGAGQSFSRTFGQTGTFPYHCTFHVSSGMTGTIVVVAQ